MMSDPKSKPFVAADDVDALVARRVEELLAAKRAEAASSGEAEPAWIQSLAMAISDLTDQGTGRRRRLPPEVIVAREQAHKRLLLLIDELRAAGEQPRYRLVNKVYLDELLVDPKWIDSQHRQQGTEIEWVLIPNTAMRPLNPAAERVWEAFTAWIGETATFDPPQGEIKVTAGGLTVIRRGAAKQEAPQVGRAQGQLDGGLRIIGRGQTGPVVTTRILGTLHPPAVQMP